MAIFSTKSNRKNLSVLLNLIKDDCQNLYATYFPNEIAFKSAIDLYEEFLTNEINDVFKENCTFSDIVIKHRQKFNEFSNGPLRELQTTNEQCTSDAAENNSYFVVFVSLREWILQSPKGEQFYFSLEINSFRFGADSASRKSVVSEVRRVFFI